MTNVEIACRDAEPAEIPRGARGVMAVAQEHDWRVRCTYARGVPSSRIARVVDSVAVRMRRDNRGAWAVWEDSKFHSACTWGPDSPIKRHNVTSLKQALGEKMGFNWDEVTTPARSGVPRGDDGRPMIVPPGGNRLVPYTRCTTFAGTLEDDFNLSRWQQRMVALGLAERPDLMVSVAAFHDDRDGLNKVCEQAIEAAKGKAAAGVGTALHKLTDRIDRGEDPGPVPAEYRADLKAFKAATASLEVVGIERFVVNDDLKVGGTFDRLYRYQGRLYVGDTKSGDIELGAGKIAMQLAIYAHSVLYEHGPNGPTREYLGDVDTERAIIVHLPAGQGRCEPRWLNIKAGWEAVQLAVDVRAWRARRGLHRPFDDMDAATELVQDALGGEVVSITDQIKAADTPEALEAVWAANKAEWAPEHTAAAKARKLQLHQRSLRKVGAGR